MKLKFLLATLFTSSMLLAQTSTDNSFANNGEFIIENNINFANTILDGESGFQQINQIALPDNKILLIGSREFYVNGPGSNDIVVIKLNEDGTFDQNFGTGGTFVYTDIDSDETVNTAKLLDDGRILIGGFTKTGFRTNNSLLLMLNSNGTLDTSFQSGGVKTNFVENNRIFDINVNATGIYLLYGRAENPVNVVDLFLTVGKLTLDGDLDTTFGNSGVNQIENRPITTSEPDLQLMSNSSNKLIVSYNHRSDKTVNIKQLNMDGSLDTSFNTSGQFVLSEPASNYDLRGAHVNLDNNNRILITTNYNIEIGQTERSNSFSIHRLLENGTIDSTFGTNGTFAYPEDSDNVSRSVMVFDNNSILVGAENRPASSPKSHFLNKFTEAGAIDNTFGKNGILETDIEIEILSTSNRDDIFYNITSGFSRKHSTLTRFTINNGGTLSVANINETAVAVYPNPTQGNLFIDGIDNASNISIYNVLGSKVLETAFQKELDLSHLTKGVYFLNIKTTDDAGKPLVRKIIKK